MRLAGFLLVLTCSLAVVVPAVAQTAPRRSYETLRAREQALADAATPPPIATLRKQVASWEAFVRRYPVSGYADDALWAAADMASTIGERTKSDADWQRAAKYFRWLAREYPTSDKVRMSLARANALDAAGRAPAVASRRSAPSPAASVDSAIIPSSRQRAARGVLPPGATTPPVSASATSDIRALASEAAVPPTDTAAKAPGSPVAPAPGVARITDVRRSILPELVRVTIELDDEVAFTHQKIEGPPRVFFDLKLASADPSLQDRVLSFSDDIVRHVRVGRRPAQATRVVLDLEGVRRYSVFTLYAPFRIVIDLERSQGPRAVSPDVTAPTLIEQWADPTSAAGGTVRPTNARPPPAPTAAQVASAAPPTIDALPTTSNAAAPHLDPPSPLAVADEPTGSPLDEAAASERGRPAARPTPKAPKGPAGAAPLAPATNATGGFSLARQLGLGVSRVVIDPGHGGHDPGALGKRVTEAELVLDVSMRLEKLLRKAGVEVVMTRRSDVFVPLDERTVIANREGADLFLSVHANASRNVKAHGVETYFLNFASNPEAEAVAARENSASGQSMRTLPDIVRAIALNNKLDESRDFARLVQDSMVKTLRGANKTVRDLGVKQAPFVVLIGAGMPSVLAEIAFVTHPQEGQLLRTTAYRQHIADALFEAVTRYIRSLKSVGTVASQDW